MPIQLSALSQALVDTATKLLTQLMFDGDIKSLRSPTFTNGEVHAYKVGQNIIRVDVKLHGPTPPQS